MASTNGPWFRHYTDSHRNLKLRRLPPATQLFFFWLCELKKERKYPCGAGELAWYLRLDEDECTAQIDRLSEAGLIKEDGEIKGWNERQFETDGQKSTARVRKHRDQKKETDETRCNNGPVFHETLPEQNRTETEQNRAEGETAPAVTGSRELAGSNEITAIAPTTKQLVMLQDKANAAGVTLEQVADDLGCQLCGVTVSKFKRHLEALVGDKPETFDQMRDRRTDEAFEEVLRRNHERQDPDDGGVEAGSQDARLRIDG